MKYINKLNIDFDNWDNIIKYYYAHITLDHIEIYPIEIIDNYIKNLNDPHPQPILKSYINKLNKNNFVFFHHKLIKTGNLVYIYNTNINIKDLQKSLLKIVNESNILSHWSKDTYSNILKYKDNFYYDGNDWLIINLI